jgi:hypothetical protein
MIATANKKQVREASPAGSISGEELSQRVAILRRFRALLAEQRDRFRVYLEALDKQQQVIESGTAEELIAHVELEEKIVTDIFSIQKVIDPLEEMYRAIYSGFTDVKAGPAAAEDDVSGLKSALEELQNEAVLRSGRNRDLLSRRMDEIRSEIKALRSNPYLKQQRSTFAPTPSLLDISG